MSFQHIDAKQRLERRIKKKTQIEGKKRKKEKKQTMYTKNIIMGRPYDNNSSSKHSVCWWINRMNDEKKKHYSNE